MARLAKITEDYEARLLQIAKHATISMGKNIINKSPVDTGLFKSSWRTSLNKPDLQSGEGASAGLIPVTSGAEINDIIFFTNHLHYSMKLEYGWSKQAPFGMVRITIANFQKYVDSAARKKRIPLK